MKSLRPWATPLTVATTLVTLVTGVLLFFHAAPGLTRVSHEWIGMLMVGAVAAHMALNWRAFTCYFRRPAGLAIMALGAAAMLATWLVAMPDDGGGRSGMRAAIAAMNGARVETLAELAGQSPEAVLARLGAAGYAAAPGQTLAELSGGDRGTGEALLGVIFAP